MYQHSSVRKTSYSRSILWQIYRDTISYFLPPLTRRQPLYFVQRKGSSRADSSWQPIHLVDQLEPASRPSQQAGLFFFFFLSNQSASLCPLPPSTSNYKQLTLPSSLSPKRRNSPGDLKFKKGLLPTFSTFYPQSYSILPVSARLKEVNPSVSAKAGSQVAAGTAVDSTLLPKTVISSHSRRA